LLVVSGATADACGETARGLTEGLSGDTADIAYTLALGRKEFPVRTAVAVAPGEDAAQALRTATARVRGGKP
jgi:acyl transferase domain-containing protein